MADAPTTANRVLPEDRRMIGLEAAWELDALNGMLTDVCSGLGVGELDQAELIQLRLQVRGLGARIGQLASVLMSVLDDDDDTASLFKKVHGYDSAQGVAHG